MSAEEAHDDVGAGRQPSTVYLGSIQVPRDLAAEVDDLKQQNRDLIRAFANITALLNAEMERLLVG